MKFSKLVLLMLLGLAVAACQKEEKVDATPQQAEDPVKVAKVDLGAASEFPAGFSPAFAYRLRSKRTDTEGGVQYRKLVVEFKGAEAVEVDSSIQDSLGQVGYRRYKTIQQENGAIVGDYGKDGHRITVTTTPLQANMSLFDPEAKGTVYFVWKP